MHEVGERRAKYRLGVGARIDEPLLEEADRELAETFRENGFLRAQVHHEIRDSKNGSLLYVHIEPGPRIVPIFEGNHSIDSVELALTINQHDWRRQLFWRFRPNDCGRPAKKSMKRKMGLCS